MHGQVCREEVNTSKRNANKLRRFNKRQRKRRQKATVDLERAQPPSTVACVCVAPPHSATLVATPIIATHEATPVATVDVVMKRPRKAVAPEEQPRKRPAMGTRGEQLLRAARPKFKAALLKEQPSSFTDSMKQFAEVPYVRMSNFTERLEYSQGGYGTVEFAKWGDRDVVLKIFRNDKGRDATNNAVLEMRAAHQGRRSPYVIRPLCHSTQLGIPVLVFPHCGKTIATVARDPRVQTTTQRLAICAKLSLALHSVHRVGYLLHNDVKSDNVVYKMSKSEITVIDFGLSITLNDRFECCNPYPSRTKNTKYWHAPELLTGATLTEHADTYGLGFVLLDVLIPSAHGVHKVPPQKGALALDYGQQVEEFVLRCFSEQPRSRPTLDELAKAFQKSMVRHTGELKQ